MSTTGPIGLLPYQLVTLLSPAISSSSPNASLPSSPTKRSTAPTSPTSSLADRLTQLATSPTHSNESPSPAAKSVSVRSVDAAAERVWVGGSDGRMRLYDVPEEHPPLPRPLSPRPVSPSLSATSASGGPALLGAVTDSLVVGQGKAVDRVATIAKLGIALVLSEGVLSFYSLPSFAPLSAPGFPAIRGVTTFSLDVDEQRPEGPAQHAHICVIKRKALFLMKITAQSITSVRDLPLPGGALLCVLRRRHVCISNAVEYSVVDIMSGSLTPLMPISQAPIPDDKPTPQPDESGIEHPTTPPPPGIDPRQRPAIACVGTDEFLIGSHIASTTMGLFVKETGEPCRGTLEWANNLRSLTVDGAYVLGLLHNYTLEIHSIHTQQIVQLIQLPNASSPASLQPRSLAYAWQGLQLGEGAGKNKAELVTVPLLGRAQLGDGLFERGPPRTPVKRTKQKETKSETRTRTLILGKNSLYALTPLTLIVQADALLDNGRAEEALALAEGIERTSTGSTDPNPDLGYVYLRAAYLALAGMRFQDAFELFLRAGSDPRLAVRLFPDLREPLIGAQDEVSVWRGLQQEVAELRSVEDYIVANLEKNYAPHLKPDVQSSPSTVELRRTLGETARDCLALYLAKWRRVRRAGGSEAAQIDSRKVDIVVDTTLVILWAEQGQEKEAAIVELLDGEHDVVLAQVEPALLAAGLHDLVGRLLIERGETTRVLDLWAKMVDGVYSIPLTSTKEACVKKVFDLVARSSEADVVARWAVWLMPHDRRLALKLVSDPHQPLKFDTRNLFAKIAEVDQDGADAFLESVVLMGRDADPSLHADLVRRAVDRLGEQLEDEGMRTFAKDQETIYLTAHADTVSFLSYLIESHDPSSSQADFTAARLKAILLLSSTDAGAYDPKEIKTRLEELSAKRGRALTFERALVYGKLRLDRQALSLLVHSLHDLTSAGRYARQAGNLVAPTELKALASKLGLPKKAVAKKKAAPAQPKAEEQVDAADERVLARLLVEMSLSKPQPESDSPLFTPDQLVKLVQTQSNHLDAVKTLEILPEDWPLHLARPYLAGALRRSLHARQEGMLLKGLANSQNLELSYKMGEKLKKRRGVLQKEGAIRVEEGGEEGAVDWAAKGERAEKEGKEEDDLV